MRASKSMEFSDYAGPFRVDGLNKGVFEKEYEIGRSAHKVLHARNRITKQQCFVYKLPKIGCPCNDGEKIRATIQMMQKLDHPNVCRLYEAFDDPAFVILVFHEVQGKTLIEEVKAKKSMSERRAAEVGWQLMRGLNAAKQMTDLAHGMLVPKNIMITPDDRVVITDFGTVGLLKQDAVHKLNKDSLAYIAPEMVEPWHRKYLQQPLKEDKNGKRRRKVVPLSKHERAQITVVSDVWSVGVILFQLLCGSLPFQGRSVAELAKKIIEDKPDYEKLSTLSSKATAFIRVLLNADPLRRPSPADLLKDVWLTESHTLSDVEIPDAVLSNMVSVHDESRFKKVIMQLIAEQLPPSKVHELESAFAHLDTSGDGFVTIAEFKDYFRRKNHDILSKSAEFDKAFGEVDKDGGGEISLHEFIIATLDTQAAVLENALWDAFKACDLNKDGKLTQKELKAVVKELGGGGRVDNESLEELLAIIDNEVPGPLTFEEFTHLAREEGGRRKRFFLGRCSKMEKSCSHAVKVSAQPCKACFATM